MATDRAKEPQVQQNRTLAKTSTGLNFSTGTDFSVETEISDETLEAVAGGVVANPNVVPAPADQS